MKGYYKFVNGEWVCAPNGIILPYTTEPTLDPKIMEENGWVWLDKKPEDDYNSDVYFTYGE